MKKIIVLGIIAFVFQSSSCNKKDPLGPQVINNSIFFLVKINNQRLPDSVLNNMKMSYYLSGQKKYVDDFTRGINEGGFMANDMGIQTTRDVGTYSGDNNVKNYYLEYPNGTIDTLFIDYRHVSYNEASTNSCYCYYPLVDVKFNSVVAQIDSSITQQRVYRFNKP